VHEGRKRAVPGAGARITMTLEDDIAFFERVPLLAALGRQALRVLAIGAETKQLPSGAVLHYAGEVADGAYLVQEGTLLLEPGTLAEGRDYTVGPGALICELALIKETPVPATAIAKEPTVVIRLSRGLFRKMLEGYPDAAETLRDIFASRLQDWSRDLATVRRKLQKD
jgi:CRP-like cAMP-binding protein